MKSHKSRLLSTIDNKNRVCESRSRLNFYILFVTNQTILISHYSEKKIIDIDKPMRCGAFVDVTSAKQYTEADFSLPETPPFSWLLRKPTTTTTTNNASLQQQQKDESSGTSDHEDAIATSTPSDDHALAGTSPSSLNEFKRSSSRWSTRTLPGEDEKLFKELHFPFATENTPISELAKFYRECFNAPPLQQFAELETTTAAATTTTLTGSGPDKMAEGSLGANPGAVTNLIERNNSINDLTKQLEQFETSLGDYDTLVTSLCQQNSEVDNNSNS